MVFLKRVFAVVSVLSLIGVIVPIVLLGIGYGDEGFRQGGFAYSLIAIFLLLPSLALYFIFKTASGKKNQ